MKSIPNHSSCKHEKVTLLNICQFNLYNHWNTLKFNTTQKCQPFHIYTKKTKNSLFIEYLNSINTINLEKWKHLYIFPTRDSVRFSFTHKRYGLAVRRIPCGMFRDGVHFRFLFCDVQTLYSHSINIYPMRDLLRFTHWQHTRPFYE